MKKEEIEIIADSREQKPLWNDCIVQGLKTGDYSFKYAGVDYSDRFAIERKSLMDLFGTLGSGHKRFKKELGRAADLDYFAIIVEGSYKQVVLKDFRNSCYSKMGGLVISKILCTLSVKYGINVFFASDRTRAKMLCKHLMESYINIQKSL